MIERLESILNSELTMLPYKFYDLEEALKLKGEFESRFQLDVGAIFQSQKTLDTIKKELGKSKFKALCALYFAQFIKPQGFDTATLKHHLDQHKAVMERHLGKEWVYMLQVLLKLKKEIDPKEEQPRGLLRRVK